MKRSSAESVARVALHDGERVCANDLLSKLSATDAARALHRVWLKGDVKRISCAGMYYYKKKPNDNHPRMG